MALKIKCTGCGRVFTPTGEQMEFIKKARARGMELIMLDCGTGLCYSRYNPQMGKEAAIKKEVAFRCPASRCTGNVTYVKDDEGPFWGCGACGSIWYDKKNLLKEIDAIVKHFKYRRKCYRKVRGKWAPAARSKEPDDYCEMVEQEPPDKAKEFVRG